MTVPNVIKSRQIKGDTIILGSLALGGVYILYNALPYINNFLGMLQTGLMRGLAIGGMLTVGALLATNFKTILRLGRVVSRNITRQFVAIDPIGFLEEIYADVEDRIEMVREKSGVIRGVIESVQEEAQEVESALKKIKARAKVVTDANQAQILGRDLERKEASLANIKKKLGNLTLFDTALTKAREICELKMQDLTSQLEEAKRQQRINKKTEGVVDDLRGVLNPGNDDVQWDDAILQIESQWDETRADMDIFMEDFQSVIANHEIDGQIALQRIEELRKKVGPSVKARIDISAVPTAHEEHEEVNLGIDTSRFKRSV